LKTASDDALPAQELIHEHGQRWQPFRSAAAWYLWRAIDLAKGSPAVTI
jgi:DNA-3-methyladenine glycosylase II